MKSTLRLACGLSAIGLAFCILVAATAHAQDKGPTIGQYFNEMSAQARSELRKEIMKQELRKMNQNGRLQESACVTEKIVGEPGGGIGEGGEFMVGILEQLRRDGRTDAVAAHAIRGVMVHLFQQCVADIKAGRYP